MIVAALRVLAVVAAAVMVYPDAPRGTVSDAYFGTSVPDPYRWMEEIDAPQTVAWVDAENALTRKTLDAVPERAAIAAAYRKLSNYEKVSAPFRAGSRWFFSRNTGLQTQAVLYVRDSENGPARAFFDPNTLSPDGKIQLDATAFTRDGALMAYATRNGGADWQTWHVKVVATGEDLPDRIEWSKFSSAEWFGDRGFYYEGYDRPRTANATFAKLGAHKVWFHRLGTPQASDRLVADSTARPDEFLSIETTFDQRYAFLERGKGKGNSLAWRRGRGRVRRARFAPLFPLDPNVSYGIVGNDGTRIYVSTNRDAPRQRIVALDLADPAHRLTDVVPQGPDKLDDAQLVGNALILTYLHDAHAVVRVVDIRTHARREIALPGIGSAHLAPTRRDDRAVYYAYQSFAAPPQIVRYDLATHTSRTVRRSPIAFDAAQYVTEQWFATSRDLTRVPVFVTHRRGVLYTGKTPTLLNGYGGFDISIEPSFSAATALWLQMGGAYAVATLRGGGEYGEGWHDAGRLANKQHVFDDFIAVANLLVSSRLTDPDRLAIDGGSNGGLLVGAVLTQHPELFGAAIAEQGVLDMLRYQRFTVGKAWIPEYGSAEASADQFATLFAYSHHRAERPR